MFGQLLERLDRKSFLHFHIWEFSYRSFFKEYARIFFLMAMLAHPGRTMAGLRNYHRFIKSRKDLFPRYKKFLSIPDEETFKNRFLSPRL